MCDNKRCDNGIIHFYEEYPLEFGGVKKTCKTFKCPSCEKKLATNKCLLMGDTALEIVEKDMHQQMSRAINCIAEINVGPPKIAESRTKELTKILGDIVNCFGFELKDNSI